MESSSAHKSIFSIPRTQLFLLICLATVAILYIKKSMIENETAAFEFLADQPAGSWLFIRSTLQYFSIPLIYAWKFTVLGFVLWMGCFMFGYRVTYAQCWSIVIVAEFVFFIPELIKIFWFLTIRTDPDYYEIQAFYPFSLINLTDFHDLPDRYHYPFKAISIFEIGYWFAMAAGIQHFSRQSLRTAMTIILGFYVPVLILWLLFYIVVYN